MKKILAIALACLLALSMLTACSGNDSSNESPSNQSPSTENSPTSNSPAANSPSGTTPEQSPDPDFDTSQLIAFYTREDGSGTRDAFISITGIGDNMSVEAITLGGTSLILTAVEENEFAIGYISVGSLSPSVKALTIEGVVPSNETIYNGTYRLQRPLLVCVTEEKADLPLVQDFIDFMLSTEGQEISSTSWTPSVSNTEDYTPSGLTGTLRVGGSTSVDPLMQRLRDAYIDLNPGVEIEISASGSGQGISEATEGIIDIGMSSRDLREGELVTLIPVAIALDGVAVIVNPSNPLSGLTIDEVRAIYMEEYLTWADLLG